MLQCVAVCCSVLQRVAVCCGVLQCAAVCCSVHDVSCGEVCCSVLQCVAVLLPVGMIGKPDKSFGAHCVCMCVCVCVCVYVRVDKSFGAYCHVSVGVKEKVRAEESKRVEGGGGVGSERSEEAGREGGK